LSFRAKCNAAEKSCDFSSIHSHVILEAFAEEVRGSTLYTTFLPLPAAKISPFRLRFSRNDKVREYVPYSFVALKDDGTAHRVILSETKCSKALCAFGTTKDPIGLNIMLI
jgi:hypothetical protein